MKSIDFRENQEYITINTKMIEGWKMTNYKITAIILISLLLLIQILSGCDSEEKSEETSETFELVSLTILPETSNTSIEADEEITPQKVIDNSTDINPTNDIFEMSENQSEPEVTETEKPIEEDTANVTIIPTDPWYQGIVDSIKALQPTEIPEHLKESSANKTGEEFDINTYFSVLPNLSMVEGYVLDYVYLYDRSFGGRPIIYMRMKNQEPYRNFEEYYKDAEENQRIEDTYDFVSLVMYGQSGTFENKIRIDGTKEGFFEYVVLQLLGGQFYLVWHANYDDTRIICNPDKIDDILKEIEDSDVTEIPPDIIQKARGLDYQPVIEFNEDTVEVKIMLFTKWGGFIRVIFIINREYPYILVNGESEVILEYNCGIMF